MDFDDLDDAIQERMAEGDMTGLDGVIFEKKELKEFTGNLPPMTAQKGLLIPEGTDEDPDREIKMRVFVFYGMGDKAEDLETRLYRIWQSTPQLDIVAYEWPGIGQRADEEMAEDLEALATDAFETLTPALEQVCEGADYEGGKFAFIGRCVGCQVMQMVAKKIIMKHGMVPSAVIVTDRAPPQYPLLSEKGKEMLDSEPDAVVETLFYEKFLFGNVNKEKLAKSLEYACEEKDPFYHKFECDVALFKGVAAYDSKINSMKSSPFKACTVTIKDSDKCFRMPVETTTTVKSVAKTVSSIFSPLRTAEVKLTGSDGEELKDGKLCPDTVLVEGIDDFEHPKYTWPHPVCIIGGGFHATKVAMMYALQKNYNFVLYDRHAQAGGDAWHLSATKYSRCQTDFGMFNIWWGHEYCYNGDGGFGTATDGGRKQFTAPFKGLGSPLHGTIASGAGTGVDYNPVRLQILDSIRYALKEFGAAECAYFLKDVVDLKIMGDPQDEKRYYQLGINSLADPPLEKETVNVSVINHFPGAYDINRIVDYPGESEFGGQIGYGMGNGQGGAFVWDDGKMPGTKTAVLGNGAFSVENVRSCAENGAAKVYIITRRKSLLCPRMPCWFCHQGPDPIPAGFLCEMFEPMFKCAGIESPWEHYAVVGTKEKKNNVQIKQSSRFGIGDVTFLLHAYGLFEYRVGTLQRCTYRTMHLSTGEKLEEMDHICKALGLLGDPRVDQLHAMTHRIGSFINGDWRRTVSADATGMDAKRFTTFSAGPGACSTAKMYYHIHNHPWEMRAAQANPDWNIVIPVHRMSDTQPDNTVYMTNVQYEMYASVAMANILTGPNVCHGDEASYKYCLINSMHPSDKMIEYCKADWERYEDLITNHYKDNGFGSHAKVPYPYTKEMVASWFDYYHDPIWGLNHKIRYEGPSEGYKKACIDDHKALEKMLRKQIIPPLIMEAKLCPSAQWGPNIHEMAELGKIYELKKDLTASDPESATNYDLEKMEEWGDLVAGEHEFTSEEVKKLFFGVMEVPFESKELLNDLAGWGSFVPFLLKQIED